MEIIDDRLKAEKLTIDFVYNSDYSDSLSREINHNELTQSFQKALDENDANIDSTKIFLGGLMLRIAELNVKKKSNKPLGRTIIAKILNKLENKKENNRKQWKEQTVGGYVGSFRKYCTIRAQLPYVHLNAKLMDPTHIPENLDISTLYPRSSATLKMIRLDKTDEDGIISNSNLTKIWWKAIELAGYKHPTKSHVEAALNCLTSRRQQKWNPNEQEPQLERRINTTRAKRHRDALDEDLAPESKRQNRFTEVAAVTNSPMNSIEINELQTLERSSPGVASSLTSSPSNIGDVSQDVFEIPDPLFLETFASDFSLMMVDHVQIPTGSLLDQDEDRSISSLQQTNTSIENSDVFQTIDGISNVLDNPKAMKKASRLKLKNDFQSFLRELLTKPEVYKSISDEFKERMLPKIVSN